MDVSQFRRIDQECDAFESAWKSGGRPSIEDYLSRAAPGDREALLAELLRLDLEYRARAGETPRPGDAPPIRPPFAGSPAHSLDHYPRIASLLDLQTRLTYPLDSVKVFRVGRSPDANLVVLDLSCSRQQFHILCVDGRWYLENLSASRPTRCEDRPVEGRIRLREGVLIQAGDSRYRFFGIKRDGDGVVTAPPGGEADSSLRGNIALPSDELIIGRHEGHVDLLLRHPTVSRRHARVRRRENHFVITDLGSANGTFVNGMRLDGSLQLRPDDGLTIGPYRLRFTGAELVSLTRPEGVELRGHLLSRTARDPRSGGTCLLMDAVSLVIPPRTFVCLIGPSGCGKSTLLAALSGRTPADRGLVLLDGQDLYARFEELKGQVVVVPQREALHETLTVTQTLDFAARLRLPPDTTTGERDDIVRALLRTVGMIEHQHKRVSMLSGGQRKRLSLAGELVGQPRVIFLDEVTSGLDEQSDREMMELFRSLAESGKSVVCVTHSLAHVERSCHHIAVLTPGGKLAFAGTPADALSYFQIDRLGGVYECLATRTPCQWQEDFRARVPEGEPIATPLRVEARDASPWSGGLRTFGRQTAILCRREAAVLLGDLMALATVLGQCLLVGGMLGLVFGDLRRLDGPAQARSVATLLFLLAICCLWFGCNNTAKAIVQERPVYARERACNLQIAAFLASRWLTRGLIAGTQGMLLGLIIWVVCRPPGFGLATLLVVGLLAVTGMTLGLLLSALARTEEVAVTLVPIVLIPQIILADVLVELEGAAKVLGRATTASYLGNNALTALLPLEVTEFLRPRGAEVGSAVLALALHVATYTLASYVTLCWQDGSARRRRNASLRRYGKAGH